MLTMDVMVLSKSPLKPAKQITNQDVDTLPSLHPMHHSIGLTKEQIYNIEDLYRK